ncbi:MAG: hypothetical protein CBB79_03965 [Synechococcus sp. TMED19]|nr:MAG: hypothetical protein CBB79_03965 [Synechococcus sp. TMED19]
MARLVVCVGFQLFCSCLGPFPKAKAPQLSDIKAYVRQQFELLDFAAFAEPNVAFFSCPGVGGWASFPNSTKVVRGFWQCSRDFSGSDEETMHKKQAMNEWPA